MDEIQRLLLDFSSMKIALEKTRLELGHKINELEEVKKNIEEEVRLKTKELREEQARLLASINSLSLGFVITDLNFKIILKNSAVEKMIGISSQYFSMESMAESLNIKFEFLLDRLSRENKKFIVKNIALDRSFLRLFFSPVNLSSDSGETIGYVFMLEDVTEQERLERARSEFFAIASHELRTPLTVIRGNMDIIRQFFADKIHDGELMKMIKNSHDSSIRLIQLVNDFLDVSSLELNKIAFREENVDLISLLSEVKDELKEIIKLKRLAVNIKNNAENHFALADKRRTKQVITNLVSNAINYNNQGGRIDVELINRDGMLEMVVSDTGVGIAPENQPLLFRKFQQAGNDIYARDTMKGTGLGLYISKLLIEGMKGRIDLVKSEVGKGSVFSFALPIYLG